MDTPPALPKPPLPPLGRTFYLTICAPLLPLALGILLSLGTAHTKNSDTPLVFLFLALPVMLGCSIAGAIMVGNRKGAGYGVLTFFGLQVLYIGIAFAGCVSTLSGMNFH